MLPLPVEAAEGQVGGVVGLIVPAATREARAWAAAEVASRWPVVLELAMLAIAGVTRRLTGGGPACGYGDYGPAYGFDSGCGPAYGYGGSYGPAYGYGDNYGYAPAPCLPVPIPVVGCW